MADTEPTYTYRAGRKIPLRKSSDQFVVRMLPEKLREMGISDAEKVSSASSRVNVRANDLEPLMTRTRLMAPTHHAYYAEASGKEFLITDRILVQFREPLPAEQVDAFAARYGLMKKTTYSDRDYLFQLTDHTGINPVKLVVKLNEQEPLVAFAEHDLNQRMSTYAVAVPTDPEYMSEWHLHTHLNDPQFDVRSSANCEAAWQLLDNFGSAEIVVGITDDGCKLDHPDFGATGKFAAWGYFRGERLVMNTDIDAVPAEMYHTGSNHGTSCAGVIAGDVDGARTVGGAPGCRLLPIQWESSGPYLLISDSKMLTALNFIAGKADVLSNSWGSSPESTWSTQVVNRITDLARNGGRRGRGILFLWAAGNENCPIQYAASLDIPCDDGWQVRPDGSWVWVGVATARDFQHNLVGIPGVMHIAALASTARRSHYSNYGPGIMLCAPTNNVHEYQRLTVQGLGITTTTGAGTGVTHTFGGTSSATPLLAGVAALTISANPDLTALEVASVLKQTASKDLNMQGYPRTPSATYDPNPVWDISPIAPFDQGTFFANGDPDGSWSPWFGFGRVDAARAVAEALRRKGIGQPGTQTFHQASTPGLNIPDNSAVGVRDVINFPASAMLSSIRVTVDITHTYIGDLRATLIAPSGTAVVLHDRNGGNAHNLQRTFDLSSTPGLSPLAGQDIQGNWTLFVQDLAAVDTGKLNRWEIEIQGNAGPAPVSLQEAAGIPIPDNNPNGIERSLATNETGMISGVQVAIDITHTYIGDLVVSLISPAGTRVVLHDRAGGSADNLIKTFSQTSTPALLGLRGQPLAGQWKLRVADLDAVDVGKLNNWSLKITRA